ncbi:MAG: hypothetical protein D6743_18955 [Calditrichaeota bacterium]|nr:MAG: hypothetical protein D6743_18955 [Calditrichota bacterium]
MRRSIHNSILFLFLLGGAYEFGCDGDDNPLEVSQLTGTYTMVSITDKVDNVTTSAGDVSQIGGVTGVVTGALDVTETTFTLSLTITPAAGSAVTLTATGFYTLNGSKMSFTITTTTIPDIDGTGTLDIDLTGNRLTLEDDETKLVFDKQ